ncbi:lipid-A-disaccharide synthase N-terminal domain-containing protein [Metallibacterium sp.]|uniref:lipid-A-disaccharide synthase N-terminal domain-containing protein n=1 Tax=Metallibacterium sp. TaxID=2940281 RepID=UPI0026331443|nr:lipid-A-disaccharide synthase N-terminal domain-containing protein [Metallibacterium sp.]
MQPVSSPNMTLMPGDLSLTGQTLWLAAGFAGQALFGMRFLVQWLYSEKHGRSVIPKAFWYLSVAGGMVLLSYAIHRDEPVFIVGEALTLLVFLRNLHLIHRKPKRD